MEKMLWNVTDLNYAALEWCNEQNSTYHQCISGVPQDIHFSKCAEMARMLQDVHAVRFYLCPERRISFDGFVTYEEIDQRQYDGKRQRDKRQPCPCVNTHEIDQGMVPGDEEHLRFR